MTPLKATAGSFDRLRTGSSTAQFAKYANSFAQDDTLFWVVTLPILAMELRRMGDGAFFATQAGRFGWGQLVPDGDELEADGVDSHFDHL
jgi:hypothetical protein